MDKLKMHTTDGVNANLERLAALFPNCVTETTDEQGNVRLAVDFDKLRMELGEVVEGSEERYQFTWPGKREAIRLANAPTNCTLRPVRDGSVDFENTQNLYIEGDNLEVLKLLRETYLGKVKMIYIDPPYNTGNDFVYNDEFGMRKEEWAAVSGAYDTEGNQLLDPMVLNTESNGRFHTDWLNMIYPRLKVARDLLADDGVIFISIDDNEVENLKKVCNEIFGEQNFIDIYNWAKTETPENLSIKCRQIIEYVLCYQKKKDSTRFRGVQKFSSSSNGLLNQPNAVGTLRFPANVVTTRIPDGVIKAGMYGTDKYDVQLLNDVEVKGGFFIEPFSLRAKFKWQQSYLDNELANGTTISIPTIKFSPSYEKKEYAPEVPTNLINSKVGVGTNENAGEYQVELFGEKVFNFPKPTSLMQYLFGFLDSQDEFIVLDFFSGSSSTAEAVMRMNIGRDAQIHYIMVQIQEDLVVAKKNASSQSQKEIIQNAINLCEQMNVPYNICEVAKERIRRAGKKIKAEHPEAKDLDIGFRVLRLDSSNMEDVYYTPDKFDEANLFNMVDNVKTDRNEEDLLFQVMLEHDVPLSARIRSEELGVRNYQVLCVDENHLIACFAPDLDESTVTEIAKRKPNFFIMRDASAANDNVLDNFEQIFRHYSPDTICKIL